MWADLSLHIQCEKGEKLQRKPAAESVGSNKKVDESHEKPFSFFQCIVSV